MPSTPRPRWPRCPGTARWSDRTATTGEGGRFALTLRVSPSTIVVARRGGGDATAGAGSRAVTIRVR